MLLTPFCQWCLGELLVRRADRLFDIIQALRGKTNSTAAVALAQKLEVTPGPSIATLQARRIPIEGEPGLGYFLRKGFDLPPLMFTMEEVEAITVGANLVHRIRDPKLQEAADVHKLWVQRNLMQKLSICAPKWER